MFVAFVFLFDEPRQKGFVRLTYLGSNVKGKFVSRSTVRTFDLLTHMDALQ